MRDNGNTIIIVAHNHDYATEKSIPDVDSKIVNHLDGKLWLESRFSKKTNEYEKLLHIKKLRGYNGRMVLDNFGLSENDIATKELLT